MTMDEDKLVEPITEHWVVWIYEKHFSDQHVLPTGWEPFGYCVNNIGNDKIALRKKVFLHG